MLPFLGEVYGNPSSVHHVGRQARVLLDDARDRVAKIFGCRPSEVVFTSGGTESNNLAILGTARLLKDRGRHLITSPIEHHAALHCFEYLEKKEGFEVTKLPVDGEGRISVAALQQALRPDTILVSIMAANNEIGTIQPVGELGMLCQAQGVVFHTDAVQWFGKEPFKNIHQFNADLVSICAHKFHGPKGAGALYIRSPLLPDPILFGGGHENERRAGTENLAGIIGFVEALERFVPTPVFSPLHLEPLTDHLRSVITKIDGIRFVGSLQHRLCNTVSFLTEHTDSDAILTGLDLEGVCVSSGSACSVGALEPSHVVAALGVEPSLATAMIRFSLGRNSTREEVEFVGVFLPEIVQRSRRC